MTRAELADLSNDSGSSAFKLTDFANSPFSVLSTPGWWVDADRIAGGRRKQKEEGGNITDRGARVIYGENNVNSKSTELSFVAVEKRAEYVQSTKASELDKDYHRIGSECSYWGTERAQTPDPMNGGSKRNLGVDGKELESVARTSYTSCTEQIAEI